MSDDNYNGDLHAWIEPEIEARVVALILNEASEFEADELERMMDERPEIRVFKRRLESVHGLLGSALDPPDDKDWQLAPEKRTELLEAIELAVPENSVPVVAGGGESGTEKDRRIRRAGRRVMFGVAACFVMTLFALAMIFRPGAKMSVHVSREASGEKLSKDDFARSYGAVSDGEEAPTASRNESFFQLAVPESGLAEDRYSVTESLHKIRRNLAAPEQAEKLYIRPKVESRSGQVKVEGNESIEKMVIRREVAADTHSGGRAAKIDGLAELDAPDDDGDKTLEAPDRARLARPVAAKPFTGVAPEPEPSPEPASAPALTVAPGPPPKSAPVPTLGFGREELGSGWADGNAPERGQAEPAQKKSAALNGTAGVQWHSGFARGAGGGGAGGGKVADTPSENGKKTENGDPFGEVPAVGRTVQSAVFGNYKIPEKKSSGSAKQKGEGQEEQLQTHFEHLDKLGVASDEVSPLDLASELDDEVVVPKLTFQHIDGIAPSPTARPGRGERRWQRSKAEGISGGRESNRDAAARPVNKDAAKPKDFSLDFQDQDPIGGDAGLVNGGGTLGQGLLEAQKQVQGQGKARGSGLGIDKFSSDLVGGQPGGRIAGGVERDRRYFDDNGKSTWAYRPAGGAGSGGFGSEEESEKEEGSGDGEISNFGEGKDLKLLSKLGEQQEMRSGRKSPERQSGLKGPETASRLARDLARVPAPSVDSVTAPAPESGSAKPNQSRGFGKEFAKKSNKKRVEPLSFATRSGTQHESDEAARTKPGDRRELGGTEAKREFRYLTEYEPPEIANESEVLEEWKSKESSLAEIESKKVAGDLLDRATSIEKGKALSTGLRSIVEKDAKIKPGEDRLALKKGGQTQWESNAFGGGGGAKGRADEQSEARKLTEDKLRSIVVPQVDFDGVTVAEALSQLNQTSKDLGGTAVVQELGMDFGLLADPAKKQLAGAAADNSRELASVRLRGLQMKDAPLDQVLGSIAEQANLDYFVDVSGAVRFEPSATTDEDQIQERRWDLPLAAWRKIEKQEAHLEGLKLNANVLLEVDGTTDLAMAPQEALQDYGITFPPGTSARYVTSTGAFMVRNTAENLSVVEKLVQGSLQQLSREQETVKEFEKTAGDEPFSTFSLNVSDVSFKLAKAALESGQWPKPEQIRVEEFVNAFDYGDPAPNQDEKVACKLEQAVHPFLQQRNLLRVSMSTAALGRSASTPLRLTVLLDNSGSMDRADRVESVKSAFRLLAAQLNPQDQVTLISFARTPRLIADRVSGNKVAQLAELVESTPSEGGTNIEQALALGVAKAKEQLLEGGQNRIILLTDGAANLGNAKPGDLTRMVESMRQQGISFDACGVGAEGLNDDILESLTRKGDGRYYFLDRPEDADAGFAKQIAGALRPAARNVKVQINFNPKRVGRYKLYGFEKHRLKKEDFRNDSVDAAELAAEEAGNAIYQVELLPEGSGDIGTASVRFQDTESGQMIEKKWTIPYEAQASQLENASSALRLACGAALLGEKLKGTPIGEAVELPRLGRLINGLTDDYSSDARVKDLVHMANKVRELANE